MSAAAAAIVGDQQRQDEQHAARVLSLFDFCWQHSCVLFPQPPLITTPRTTTTPQLPPPPLKVVRGHRRSRSADQDTAISSASDSSSALPKPSLQTILSGKEGFDSAAPKQQLPAPRRGRRRPESSSRSLSELEFEELKGFLDLGFEFPDDVAAADEKLASLVPALRRRGSAVDACSADVAEGYAGVRRPYLSEAWGVREAAERRQRALAEWRLPDGAGDMKENLRLWAHAVASTVR